MANSHTVHGVLGYLMSLIGTRRKIVWAGDLGWMRGSDSNFKSLQRQVSIDSMTGVDRWCSCFQMCLNIHRMILWWKSAAPRNFIPQSRVRCMLSGLKKKDAQQDAAHWMIQIAKPWTIRRWSESKLANGKPLVRIPKENAHPVHLEWTEGEQAKLKTLVEWYTSRGASGACRVHQWRLACLALELGVPEDRNDVSGQWYDEWPLDTWVDSPIVRWLRDKFLPMLVNEPAEYPEPDEDEASNEALLLQHEIIKSTLPRAPPPQKGVPFCPLPGQVHRLKSWLTKFFADHVDIFYMYAEMGNDEHTEMQLKFQDSPNPSGFVITPKVGGTGPNLTAANHAVLTQKFWVLNKQRQAFAWVVRLGHNRVPHTWLLNTGPGGYDNRASDLHQLYGAAQMKLLHGLMSQQKITTSMIYQILECREDHTKKPTPQRGFVASDGEDER